MSVAHVVGIREPWPTPTATMIATPTPDIDEETGRRRAKGTGSNFGPNLAESVAAAVQEPWPTPRASESEQRQRRRSPSQAAGRRGKSLAAEVGEAEALLSEPWPTPTANIGVDRVGPSQLKRDTTPLGAEVHVRADDFPDPETTDEDAMREYMHAASLHARWTLALMGYPPDWCDDPEHPDPESGDYPGWDTPDQIRHGWQTGAWEANLPRVTIDEYDRAHKLKAAGNAIVPIVAYEVLRVMLGESV